MPEMIKQLTNVRFKTTLQDRLDGDSGNSTIAELLIPAIIS